jgi:hypothetical protein
MSFRRNPLCGPDRAADTFSHITNRPQRGWSTSVGLALPELSRASAGAAADQQAELVRTEHAVLAVTHGPSLVAIAMLYGIAVIGFGAAPLNHQPDDQAAASHAKAEILWSRLGLTCRCYERRLF